MGQGVFELESLDHSGSNIYFGHRSRKMNILGFREYAATAGAGDSSVRGRHLVSGYMLSHGA